MVVVTDTGWIERRGYQHSHAAGEIVDEDGFDFEETSVVPEADFDERTITGVAGGTTGAGTVVVVETGGVGEAVWCDGGVAAAAGTNAGVATALSPAKSVKGEGT